MYVPDAWTKRKYRFFTEHTYLDISDGYVNDDFSTAGVVTGMLSDTSSLSLLPTKSQQIAFNLLLICLFLHITFLQMRMF